VQRGGWHLLSGDISSESIFKYRATACSHGAAYLFRGAALRQLAACRA